MHMPKSIKKSAYKFYLLILTAFNTSIVVFATSNGENNHNEPSEIINEHKNSSYNEQEAIEDERDIQNSSKKPSSNPIVYGIIITVVGVVVALYYRGVLFKKSKSYNKNLPRRDGRTHLKKKLTPTKQTPEEDLINSTSDIHYNSFGNLGKLNKRNTTPLNCKEFFNKNRIEEIIKLTRNKEVKKYLFTELNNAKIDLSLDESKETHWINEIFDLPIFKKNSTLFSTILIAIAQNGFNNYEEKTRINLFENLCNMVIFNKDLFNKDDFLPLINTILPSVKNPFSYNYSLKPIGLRIEEINGRLKVINKQNTT